MPSALICSTADIEAELGHTLLWRMGLKRQQVKRADEARTVASSVKPDLVLVDRDLPGAEALVAGVRADAGTRAASIVVMARGDFETSEIELLEAGANAILRLPAGKDWDERLQRLIDVPTRRDARFSVFFNVEGSADDDGSPIVGTALNLSVSGMLLETPNAIHMGSELQLQFRLPDGDELVKGTGKVVRHGGARRFGVEFVELTPTGAEAIRHFVEHGGDGALPSSGW